jgi:hypothetical protein
MSHATKDCLERPRAKGAKWTNKNIAADEKVEEIELHGWDSKRDRWARGAGRGRCGVVCSWAWCGVGHAARLGQQARQVGAVPGVGHAEGLLQLPRARHLAYSLGGPSRAAGAAGAAGRRQPRSLGCCSSRAARQAAARCPPSHPSPHHPPPTHSHPPPPSPTPPSPPRYNGYDAGEYSRVVERYEQLESVRREIKVGG